MKFLVAIVLLTQPLEAALLATFQTSRGNITAELQYDKAPQAVASFITLAQGTRAWIDPANGTIRRDPFFKGTSIHRTSNTSSFKFAQGGSRLGNGLDGPGYTLKDEISATLTHVPYVLSMANSGPNTSGSQFFFTGNISQPTFDNTYTIFGLVSDSTSRSVVDAMIAAGPNGTQITGITFARTDPAAVAFDEQARNLPEVVRSRGRLAVTRSVAAIWNFDTPIGQGDILHAFRSFTLQGNTWSEVPAGAFHLGIGAPSTTPYASSVSLDNAAASKAFYHLALVHHPDAYAPSSLANRTLALAMGSDVFYYQFNASASGGIAAINPGTPSAYTFPFDTLDFESQAHGFSLIVENHNLLPQYQYFLSKMGCDSATSTVVNGRHITQTFNGASWDPYKNGAAAVTR